MKYVHRDRCTGGHMTKRVYVDVSDDVAKELKKRVIDNNTTIAAVLRGAISKYMTDHPKKVEPARID